MQISFINPVYLLFIPLLFLFVFFVMKNKYFKTKLEKLILISVRFIIFTILILSVSGMQININSNKVTTIYAVDMSASTQENKEEILEFVNESLKYKTKNDYTGMVCFGENSSIERIPNDSKNNYNLNSIVNINFTDIVQALNLSKTLFNNNSKKRIVLISDGQENVNSSVQEIKNIKDENIHVDVYNLKNTVEEEIQITNLNVDKYINKDSNYNIEIEIDSTIENETEIIIYKQNKTIYKENIKIKKGSNKFVISDKADIGASVIYKAEIKPNIDTFYQNNSFYAYSYVTDIANVLLIDNNFEKSEFKKIAEKSNINLTSVKSFDAPEKVENLNLYDSVIINDCSFYDMPENFPQALESYVKDFGGGLFVLGGENSYGIGGYQNTPLEDMLPIDMEIKNNEKIPTLGMVIIMDRSGSMSSNQYGVSKLELAKEAVIRAIETMNSEDSVGVISFDDSFEWVSDFKKLENNKQEVIKNVSNVSEGGGTSILPALEEGLNILKNKESDIKHIILLTDGQAERTGYDSLINVMNNNNVTLSTVAVGEDADSELLKKLSEQGNGRYYYTNEFTDLPKIFAKETTIAGKSYINNRTFYPDIKDENVILTDVNKMPVLNGYISSTGKARADIILESDKKEPIIALWQYGLGKSAVWTSDMSNWANEWINSEEGLKIIRNTLSFITRKQSFSDIGIDIKQNEKNSTVFVKIPDNKIPDKVTGNISGGNKNINLEFQMVSPQEYKADIPINEEGLYILNLQIKSENDIQNLITGLNIAYSSEYDLRRFKSGVTLMQQIAYGSGGRIIEKPEDVFSEIDDNVYNKMNLSGLFLVLAMLLFIFDIALRRFNFILDKIEYIFKRVFNIKYFCKNIKKSEKNFKNDVNYVYNVDSNKIKDKDIKESKNNKNKKQNNTSEKKENTSSLLLSKKKNRTGK